ncbi:MAG: TIGR00366 family protein [Rhodospirillaceae bacterium]|nr:TIGR00366 family protein [Rhodospirillaceae bacterium]
MTQASVQEHENNIPEKMGFVDKFTLWSIKWVPDAWVFVLVITLIVFGLALALTDHGPLQIIKDYQKGFWSLLTFAMQMSVLMITGFAVAESSYVKKLIIRLIDIPKTASATLVMFTLIAGFLWWMHWGIGMMVSIMMGREIAVRKQGLGIHYPILAAISYCLIVLANGPSQAAQLLVATPGHFIESVTGVIPLTLTTFDPHLLVSNLFLFVTLPILFLIIVPKGRMARQIDAETAAALSTPEPEDVPKKDLSPAERWNRSWVLQVIIAAMGLYAALSYFYENGIARIDLNSVNFTFLFLAMLLHKNPRSFIASVQRGTSTVAGVIIQFPMYAGIFGMISFSGLAGIIAHWFVSISTQGTFPWIVFLYTTVLDIFVPSAGSKFVIEAPYLIPAGKELGASIPHVINAYTWGSVCSNMIQPFWALPILGAYKVKFQDILPFTVIIWAYCITFFSITLLLWPAGF